MEIEPYKVIVDGSPTIDTDSNGSLTVPLSTCATRSTIASRTTSYRRLPNMHLIWTAIVLGAIRGVGGVAVGARDPQITPAPVAPALEVLIARQVPDA